MPRYRFTGCGWAMYNLWSGGSKKGSFMNTPSGSGFWLGINIVGFTQSCRYLYSFLFTRFFTFLSNIVGSFSTKSTGSIKTTTILYI